MGELLQSAATGGERLLFDVAGEQVTCAGALEGAGAMAGALAALGVQAGDRVATLLDNSLDAVLVWLGVNLLGAVEVPVNTAYRGEFLRHQLADAEAALVVAEAALAGRVAEVAAGLPDLRHLVVRGEGEGEAAAVPGVSVHRLAHLDGAGPPSVTAVVSPSDLAMLVYTSGTTGPSKGCMLSHRYVVEAGRRLAAVLGMGGDSVLYTPNPLFHVNARFIAVIGTLITGGRAAIDARFSVSRFWGEVNRTEATIASLIGAMIPLLAQAPESAEERANRTLRTVFGAPFTPTLIETYRDRFGIRCLYSVYGLTEAAPLTSLPPDEDGPPGSAGRPDPAFDVRIVDDEDREVPPGGIGEMVARPRQPGAMFDGYWGRPADTLAAMRNLWFHTGDLGRIDDDGYFFFVDRKKDYLRCRGENISSFELERAFMAHPELAEVAVHAVPSALGEDDLKVTAVLRPGVELTEDELVRWCLDKVPYFAVPRYVEFRAELPKNPVQRVLKYQLRAEGVTPSTWDRQSSGIVVQR
ncbi:MAG TPA: AMP-binding protein [Acidimicrobiia bacterium]|nr:AMP-binding protein [Acidimicrobiia bacterium]